ncbi:MAG: hypothetical protein DME76_06055 [Verrucomicrobia bacterium]|nr:MAG: hypothetical protein DME76_06055 [Verrucomicrobiota bacterium]
MLFNTKVGKYTEEEFETAFGQFKETNKPFIFTYFKDTQVSTASANESDFVSLWAFKKKLAALGHFPTTYRDVGDLKYKFRQQLDKLVARGFIELTSSNGAIAETLSQPPSPTMPFLAYGSWTLRNELVGTEEVAGFYIAATRQVTLEGESVSEPKQLAVGSYSAYLSADQRELTDGRWGSTAQTRDAGSPGRWEASR